MNDQNQPGVAPTFPSMVDALYRDLQEHGRHAPAPPTEPITLVRATRTCFACPSQWDAWDAAGQYYYLRYRFGHGTVETAPGPDFFEDAGAQAVLVAAFDHGDPLDGTIGLAEFARHAGITLGPALAATEGEGS